MDRDPWPGSLGDRAADAGAQEGRSLLPVPCPSDASVLGHFLTKVTALGLRQVTLHTTRVPEFPSPGWVCPRDTQSGCLTHTRPLSGGAPGLGPCAHQFWPGTQSCSLAWVLNAPAAHPGPQPQDGEASSFPPPAPAQAIAKYLGRGQASVRGTYTPGDISQTLTLLLTVTVRAARPRSSPSQRCAGKLGVQA